jgi:N-acetylmuramoyl-L-alanine amidase
VNNCVTLSKAEDIMKRLRLSTMAGLLSVMTAMGHAQVGQPPMTLPTQRPKVARPAPVKSRSAVVKSGAAAANPRSAAANLKPVAAPQKSAARNARHISSSVAMQAPIALGRNVIVLDAAHGGMDSGSRISDTTLEKDVTLALAFRLRSLLTARGFSVVMTRDEDGPATPDAAGSTLTLDDRAGIANHAHAAACLVLHATGSGTGVHLYRSEMEASKGEAPLVPWLTAQAAWIPQSQLLEKQMVSAFSRSGLGLVASSASVRPIDSLTCPALVVELAPSGDDADSINDTEYQQRVALTIAGAMLFWQNRVQAPERLSVSANADTGPAAAGVAAGAHP